MNFDESVVGIRLARQQSLDLPALGLGFDGFQQVDALLRGGFVALHLAEFDKRDGVFQLALEFLERAEPVSSSVRSRISFWRVGVVPEVRVFGLGVQFREAAG